MRVFHPAAVRASAGRKAEMRLRKNQSDVSGDVIREDGKRRRREGRGSGPFSGGQLTVIIVTFAVLLLAPVGAEDQHPHGRVRGCQMAEQQQASLVGPLEVVE